MGTKINNLYEFEEFCFESAKNRLSRGGQASLLSPKASELLDCLLSKRGEFVSKEEIFEKVWPDTFVEDGVLTQNIYLLRKALGKDSNGQPLIENKTRLGYRITVPVVLKTPELTALTETAQVPELPPASTKPVSRKFVYLAIFAVLLLIGGYAGWRYFARSVSTYFRKPIETVKFTQITKTGDLLGAVLSPDGALIAFVKDDGLFLKDLNTEKEIKVEVSNVKSFASLQFSPDGAHLYFRSNSVLQTQKPIMKVSRFGGEAQTIIEKSWGSFSISPDGNKVAYFLNIPPIAKFNLKVRDLQSGSETEFFAAEQPSSVCLVCAPAWSPDGNRIIYSTNIPTGTGQLFMVNLQKQSKEELKPERLRRFEQAAWLPDGESFIVSATDGSRFFHLWKVYLADGQVEPLTNGLSTYGKATISRDGRKILTMRSDESSNLFVSDAANPSQLKQLTFGNQNSFGQNGVHWIDPKRLLFSYQTEQNLAENLAIVNLDDGARTLITNENKNSYRIPISDGKHVWFTMNKENFSHIFQMDIDGKNVRQLTNGSDGQRVSPRLTKDSRFLFYVLRGKESAKILRFNLETQKEEVFFDNPEFQPGPFMELSPDNKFLTFFRMRERSGEPSDNLNAVMTVVSIENIGDIKFFPASIVPPIRRFSPESNALDYIFAETDATQLVRQAFDGSEPKPIVTITDGKIFNFAWSKDGKRLAIAKGRQTRDAVLLSDFAR